MFDTVRLLTIAHSLNLIDCQGIENIKEFTYVNQKTGELCNKIKGKTSRISFIQYNSCSGRLEVELSIPKLLYSENITLLNQEDVQTFFTLLEDELYLDCKLILDEEYAPIVREIFDLYLNKDWGMYKISNYLMEKNVPTPRTVSGGSNAGEIWHQSTIKLILSNIIYTGTLVYHREETINFISKKRKQIHPSQQIMNENAHTAIITMCEYQEVQEKMKKKGRSRSNGQESLFAHIAVCGDCGKGMTFRNDRRKNGAYVCCGYVKHSRSFCSSHIIESDALLHAVKENLKELIADNVKLEKLFNVVNGKASTQQMKYKKELANVTKRLDQLTKEFQNLLHLYTEKIVNIEQFKVQNEHVQVEQSKLANRKAELESIIETEKDTDEQIRAFQKQISRFAKLDIDNEQVMKQVLLD